jgi:hypothetical protein
MFRKKSIWFKIVIYTMILAMLLSSFIIFLELFTVSS